VGVGGYGGDPNASGVGVWTVAGTVALCGAAVRVWGEKGREVALLCFASVRGSLSCDFGPDPWTNWCGARAYGGIRAGPVAGQRAPPV